MSRRLDHAKENRRRLVAFEPPSSGYSELERDEMIGWYMAFLSKRGRRPKAQTLTAIAECMFREPGIPAGKAFKRLWAYRWGILNAQAKQDRRR